MATDPCALPGPHQGGPEDAEAAGYLQQHPEIDAVLTAGSTAFDPALAAIEEAGLSDQIAIGELSTQGYR